MDKGESFRTAGAEEIGGVVAQDRLHGRADVAHPSIGVDHHDDVVAVLDEAAKARLAPLEAFGRIFALGE